MKKKLLIICIAILISLSVIKTDVFAYSTVYYNNQIIKVALISLSSQSLSLTVNGEYSLNNEVLPSGTSITVQLSEGKLKIGDKAYDTITLTPNVSSNFIAINKGTEIRRYRGTLLLKIKDGKIYPINTVNIEDYLKGVVGYEMSDYFQIEALKAQAIASRTYGVYKINKASEFDVTDEQGHQVYKGFNPAFKNVEQAVEQTKGEILFYNGYVLAEALFSANHGGYSEDAVNVWGNPVEYLKSKKDDYDDYTKYENSKSYDWTATFNSQQLSSLINKYLKTENNEFVRMRIETMGFYVSGRVSKLEIEYLDSAKNAQLLTLSRYDAKTFFGVNSSMYTVSFDSVNNSYTLTGHGSGHGLGMSQIGALNRARGGQTYKQILTFYYTGAVVDKRSASISSAAISAEALLTSQNLNVEVKGQGGSSASYQYKYVIERDGQVEAVIDYSENSTLSYQINKIGNYIITVFLKDAMSQDDYDDKRTLSFSATGFGDVNTDKTVDIYDLVSISKKLDTVKDNNSQWDMKLDLESDGIINMRDLAKAAKSYNVKY
ncbi:SpoIID/LytB domain-containing protein [Clostridium swellfunianum]|uniref:SpoIID/LytB domain-containing protein n=1 Tax=Clostridium swellfunianum TaxID=1367462 RepID=UPI002030E345|nr:SpoIID/LytB domain-containing protein [Clostridium swellfunianum]MCM0647453.1 SpoIID/LytB domain-containing protein [Clostridium swellfunianum]